MQADCTCSVVAIDILEAVVAKLVIAFSFLVGVLSGVIAESVISVEINTIVGELVIWVERGCEVLTLDSVARGTILSAIVIDTLNVLNHFASRKTSDVSLALICSGPVADPDATGIDHGPQMVSCEWSINVDLLKAMSCVSWNMGLC